MNSFIILNPSYGRAPYLMTVRLALEINKQRRTTRQKPFGIILPLAYGAEQKKVLLDAFKTERHLLMSTILFDPALGRILRSAYFDGKNYQRYLAGWNKNFTRVHEKINRYFKAPLKLHRWDGKMISVRSVDIHFQISRSPRALLPVTPHFHFSFGRTSDILKRVRPRAPKIGLRTSTIERAIKNNLKIEQSISMEFISIPNPWGLRLPVKKKKTFIGPPTVLVPRKFKGSLEDGVYLNVSGIPHVRRDFYHFLKKGIKVYSNVRGPKVMQTGPGVIGRREIKFVVARSGWGTVYQCLAAEKPIYAYPYGKGDDPEIYLNNQALRSLGIGDIFKVFDWGVLNQKSVENKIKIKIINRKIKKLFGTGDGFKYIAQKINQFVRKY